MPKDDDIDDQVKADLEFTRRAEKLLARLRSWVRGEPLPPENDYERGEKEEKDKSKP